MAAVDATWSSPTSSRSPTRCWWPPPRCRPAAASVRRVRLERGWATGDLSSSPPCWAACWPWSADRNSRPPPRCSRRGFYGTSSSSSMTCCRRPCRRRWSCSAWRPSGGRGPPVAESGAAAPPHRHQLQLPRLIAQRPQVDALAASLGVTREELGAVPGGTDADLRTKLVGISPQDWSQDVGEHTIALCPVLRYPGPHRRERVGKPPGSRPRSAARAPGPRARRRSAPASCCRRTRASRRPPSRRERGLRSSPSFRSRGGSHPLGGDRARARRRAERGNSAARSGIRSPTSSARSTAIASSNRFQRSSKGRPRTR